MEQLGHEITRSRLASEDEGARNHFLAASGLDLVVKMNDVENVQRLPFVFMDALHLHVEQRVRVDLDVLRNRMVSARRCLFRSFTSLPPLNEIRIIGEFFQTADARKILRPPGTDLFGDHADRGLLALSNQRLGVMPLVLLWNFSGVIS